MTKQPLARHGRSVAAAIALVAALAPGATARQPMPMYGAVAGGPSVLLPSASGASPYSGVGRYEGQSTCTAFFLATVPRAEDTRGAPAYALTSGHCATEPGANEVVVDRPGVGRVVFNVFADSERRQMPIPIARIAYASAKGRDIAVVELAASYRDLAMRLVRPWHIADSLQARVGDSIAVVGAPLRPYPAEAFLRLATCRSEGVAPLVIEHTWHWFDSPFNRCRDVAAGSSGSPVLSVFDGQVVGLVNTTTAGAGAMTECALDHPCEPVPGGARTRAHTNYVTALAGINACFDQRRRFDVHQPGCPLDPGTELAATPSYLGAVNPQLTTQPIGEVHRRWNVTVTTAQPFYRYAVASPPLDDCRTAAPYSNPISVTATPTIDSPLPVVEGFSFLCIVETATSDGSGAGAPPRHPLIVIARTDLTPPRMPAQMTIADDGAAWRIGFETAGSDVTFHAIKFGPPPDTRCQDAAGYRLAAAPFGLPKANAPYVLCAIPYDAAQNAGRLLERLLP
jgi:hypothetical protein